MREDTRLTTLIAATAAAAAVAVAASLPGFVDALTSDPEQTLAFVLLTLVLQALAVQMPGAGHIGVGAVGMLACAIAMGPRAAVVIAAAAVLVRRPRPFHRYVFDCSMWAVTTGAAAVTFELLHTGTTASGVAAAVAAGVVFVVVNHALLCSAIGLSESAPPVAIWRERFAWAKLHHLTFGPLAYAAARGYDAIGIAGLLAFGLPPGLLILSFRQYANRTREAIEQVQSANRALHEANADVATSRDDMRELYLFASGLASHASDRAALVSYAEGALSQMTGTAAQIVSVTDAGTPIAGTALLTAGGRVGTLLFAETPTSPQWPRLRDTVIPQLATALEGAELAERVRRTHLQTIAALSKSMETKDGYTGDHTERVADVAVALGRRVGYAGVELEAIHVGALLHDIGKIGIPESILHKPAPLSPEEWAVMEQHPILSESILQEVDVHPIVLQIARSSHERIDGKGYPDAKWGADIPLPARIVLVADAFDALTSDRPYRRGRPPHAALAELRAHAGTQFCPTVIAALDRIAEEEPAVLGIGLAAVDERAA